jgi:hypothetical protein
MNISKIYFVVRSNAIACPKAGPTTGKLPRCINVQHMTYDHLRHFLYDPSDICRFITRQVPGHKARAVSMSGICCMTIRQLPYDHQAYAGSSSGKRLIIRQGPYQRQAYAGLSSGKCVIIRQGLYQHQAYAV